MADETLLTACGSSALQPKSISVPARGLGVLNPCSTGSAPLARVSSPLSPTCTARSQNGFVCVLTAEGQEASEVTLTWLAINRFPPHPGERAC